MHRRFCFSAVLVSPLSLFIRRKLWFDLRVSRIVVCKNLQARGKPSTKFPREGLVETSSHSEIERAALPGGFAPHHKLKLTKPLRPATAN